MRAPLKDLIVAEVRSNSRRWSRRRKKQFMQTLRNLLVTLTVRNAKEAGRFPSQRYPSRNAAWRYVSKRTRFRLVEKKLLGSSELAP